MQPRPVLLYRSRLEPLKVLVEQVYVSYKGATVGADRNPLSLLEDFGAALDVDIIDEELHHLAQGIGSVVFSAHSRPVGPPCLFAVFRGAEVSFPTNLEGEVYCP